ncbi:MAG: 23S rRNA (guanosine(2251)-2'-O)-methyltransferase RlmB [Treponema sp.]|jgi:23S rRNA (guanosine2251-2'-O)-methyltransferase|nr:23S rRNA (guanosine(2251)-2'-O)-methyltransferase RlmB [Treponema sp.]
MYLTGFHAIEERLKAGGGTEFLVAKAGPRAREILSLAVERKVKTTRVGTFDLDRLAPNNRGVALKVEDAGDVSPLTLETALAALGDRENALVAIMDEITDPHNYGAIIRSCDQFGVDFVITRDRRIAKRGETVALTSAGASAWVTVVEAPLQRAMERLKDAGFWIFGADMAGDSVFEKKLSGRIALVFGGEGSGLSRLVRKNCDRFVAVPSFGKIASLNVSVAAGVLFYEVRRQRREQG